MTCALMPCGLTSGDAMTISASWLQIANVRTIAATVSAAWTEKLRT